MSLSAQYKLLLPYGASFAALWHKFCRSTNFCRLKALVLMPYGPVLKIERIAKSWIQIFFWGGVCKILP